MVDTSSPRLMSRSILVHMFWPPLLLDLLLLLCRRRRPRSRYYRCCCCCAVTRSCVRSKKRKTRNSLLRRLVLRDALRVVKQQQHNSSTAAAQQQQQQRPAPLRSLGLAVVLCLRCRACVCSFCVCASSLPWLRGFGLGIKLGARRPIVWTAGARMNLERSSVQMLYQIVVS